MTAMTEKTRFAIGDWIVHNFHGIGRIEDIIEKGLNGNKKLYYRVSAKEIEYWIPLEDDDSDLIEPVRTKSEFVQALDIIGKKPRPIAKHHKSRKKKIHDRWRIGSLESRAELLRDLYGRLKLKKLSFSEKEMMEKIRDYFLNEWLIADQDLTRKAARKKLRAALKSSVKKGRRSRKKEQN